MCAAIHYVVGSGEVESAIPLGKLPLPSRHENISAQETASMERETGGAFGWECHEIRVEVEKCRGLNREACRISLRCGALETEISTQTSSPKHVVK